MPRRSLALAALTIAASSAFADASVVIAITNPTETDKITNDPVSTTASLVLSDSSAFGYANLDTGVLRSTSDGPPAQPASGFPAQQFSTQSAAQIQDSVTFGAGASGTGYLDWQFDGTLSAFALPVHSATAALALGVGGFGETVYLANDPTFCGGSQPLCFEGTSIHATGSIPFEIAPGTMQISAFLQTVAFDGSTADFSNTGMLYLRLPTGMAYTSGSGTFLQDAAPIVATVPEPSPLIAMLLGLGLVARFGRRSRA
jgi:hypothetical protein